MPERDRILALMIWAVLGCNGSDTIGPPCPAPPGETVPAAETVSVGGIATFALPASQLSPNRHIQWSSDRTAVATIPADTGRATAHAVGTAIIMALDRNSPANCPIFWEGQLVVR